MAVEHTDEIQRQIEWTNIVYYCVRLECTQGMSRSNVQRRNEVF